MNAQLSQAMSGEEIARRAMETPAQQAVNVIQEKMSKMPQVDCPLEHQFATGFYLRTIKVPAGTLVVSKIFKADFPFFISKGKVAIWVEGQGVVHREAPFWGFTKAGARRIIYHKTYVEWTTLHENPLGLQDVDLLEKQIIYTPDKETVIDVEIMKQLKEDGV